MRKLPVKEKPDQANILPQMFRKQSRRNIFDHNETTGKLFLRIFTCKQRKNMCFSHPAPLHECY